MTTDAGCALLDQINDILAAPNPMPRLDQLRAQAQGHLERGVCSAFLYRLQAVEPGVTVATKAERYRRASIEFRDASLNAPTSIKTLLEARQLEHEAFALIAEAGETDLPEKRREMYWSASHLLGQALEQFPSQYRNTRSFVEGWRFLCVAKTVALRADQTADVKEKSSLHRDAGALFCCSAESFVAAGQGSLALISKGWQTYSAGWSSLFAGDLTSAQSQFQDALDLFSSSGRNDLHDSCLECLEPLTLIPRKTKNE